LIGGRAAYGRKTAQVFDNSRAILDAEFCLGMERYVCAPQTARQLNAQAMRANSGRVDRTLAALSNAQTTPTRKRTESHMDSGIEQQALREKRSEVAEDTVRHSDLLVDV
jgi:hypothetical protein